MKLNKVFRYQDDVTCINADNVFTDVHKDIYPIQLTLNKENDGTQSANVLDLALTIHDKQIVMNLYDKRDYFPFKVQNFPDLHGNIPAEIAYNTVYCQIERYFKLCDQETHFKDRCERLFNTVKEKNYTLDGLQDVIRRFMNKHGADAKKKYGNNAEVLKSLCV